MHSFMLLLVLVRGMGTEMPLQAAGDQHLIVKILEMGNVIAPLSAIARRHASCLALGRKKRKKKESLPSPVKFSLQVTILSNVAG